VSDNNELVISPTSGMILSPVMNLAVAKQRLKEFQEFVREYLVEGEDFGTIPGTPKPTLYKPGSDKLCELYGLSDSYSILSKTEDFDSGLFDYTVECSLTSRSGGFLVATGLGSCSSFESKYRWREGRRKCPKCGAEAIIKGKQEYGGGWLCFAKKGGCGAKFNDRDEAIISQSIERIPNPDIIDLKNTILKMAKKRAKVDATLSATRSSGVFTQDIEDIRGTGEPPDPPSEHQWSTEEERQQVVKRRVSEIKKGTAKEEPQADERKIQVLVLACKTPADFNAILPMVKAASNAVKTLMMATATKLGVAFDRESGRFVATAASAPPNPSEAPQPSPKASSSPESTTTATETASPEPESDLIQQEVTVKKAEKRNRRGKGVFWLLTCKIADSDNDLMVHVWHKSFHEYASAMVGKVCDLGLKRTEKDDAVFYSLEDIFQIGDVLYANGKPVDANNTRPPSSGELFGAKQ
jgi:hypothetical protein